MIEIDIRGLVETLGGRVTGTDSCDVPGPGHSREDHSLSIKIDATAPDGFKCFSHAGDDWKECRDYVRTAAGLPPFEKPRRAHGHDDGGKWKTLGEYTYRDADGAPYLRVRKFQDETGHKRYAQAHWDGKAWTKGKPAGPKIPYCLPALLKAPPDAPIYVVEGEKCADALNKLGFIATTNSEGAAGGKDDTAGKKWPNELNEYFRNRNVVLIGDHDAPGRRHVNYVAKRLKGIASRLRTIDLSKHWPGDGMPEGYDVCEFFEQHDRAGARLAAITVEAPDWEPEAVDEARDSATSDVDREIFRLAKLTPVQYEKERKAAAERMGVRASILDKLVAAERPDDKRDDLQGRSLTLPEPKPWTDAAVDGAELLDGIADAIASHVILPATCADVVALWTLHTHVSEAFTITPRLAIMSPVKGCGKTTLLDVVACLVWRPLPTANASTAGIFRAVEMARPTLLLDEADRFVTNQHDELVGILNSGHRVGGSVLRTAGDDNEPRMFATFAPCAFALIGRLPDTLEDRSVAIDLRRRTASEAVKPFRLDRTGHLHTLARKAVRWAADHIEALRAADPDVGDLFNRVADNWRPLLAIADVAGGDWPARARKAAEAASNREADDSAGVELLLDIRAIFAEKQTDRLASADMATALAQIEGRPWAEWGRTRDKPITQNALARLLKKFMTADGAAIAPTTIRVGDHTPKGYLLDQFADAFERYLGGTPESEPQHRNKPTATGTSTAFQTATRESDVAVEKCEKPPPSGRCCGVAVEKRGIQRNATCATICEHCGAPEQPGDLCNEVAADGRTRWIHTRCLDAFIGATDDGGIPPFLRRAQ